MTKIKILSIFTNKNFDMKRTTISLLIFFAMYFGANAQYTTNQDSIQNVLNKVQQKYASFKNSKLKYQFYQKFSSKLDTIPYHIEAISHLKTGFFWYSTK